MCGYQLTQGIAQYNLKVLQYNTQYMPKNVLQYHTQYFPKNVLQYNTQYNNYSTYFFLLGKLLHKGFQNLSINFYWKQDT